MTSPEVINISDSDDSSSDDEKERYLKMFYPNSSKFIEVPLDGENGMLLLGDIQALEPNIFALNLSKEESEKLYKHENGCFKEPKEKWSSFKVFVILKNSSDGLGATSSMNNTVSTVKSETNESRQSTATSFNTVIKQEKPEAHISTLERDLGMLDSTPTVSSFVIDHNGAPTILPPILYSDDPDRSSLSSSLESILVSDDEEYMDEYLPYNFDSSSSDEDDDDISDIDDDLPSPSKTQHLQMELEKHLSTLEYVADELQLPHGTALFKAETLQQKSIQYPEHIDESVPSISGELMVTTVNMNEFAPPDYGNLDELDLLCQTQTEQITKKTSAPSANELRSTAAPQSEDGRASATPSDIEAERILCCHTLDDYIPLASLQSINPSSDVNKPVHLDCSNLEQPCDVQTNEINKENLAPPLESTNLPSICTSANLNASVSSDDIIIIYAKVNGIPSTSANIHESVTSDNAGITDKK